jgi:serine/threonine-protein kinase
VDDLELNRRWTVGAPIGSGGFGRVFEATSADGETGVVKLVRKEPGAERELLFVELFDAPNVVPIIDSGETTDEWALVMPRAEKSLREHLVEAAGPLGLAEAIAILRDIGTALAALDGRVVHRDLKPENVLLLNGVWCLADFGISRYAEASTAPDTRKYAFTPPYNAPERWRDEHATAAADIYAVGVIAHELLRGERPFNGPTIPDYREQHLHLPPPPVPVAAGLATLIEECLYKAPQSRPPAANFVARLDRATRAARSSGLAKLQEANQAHVIQEAARTVEESRARTEADRRDSVYRAALLGFDAIAVELRETLAEAAPSVSFDQRRPARAWSALLNDATLDLSEVSSVERPDNLPFDVIAIALIAVRRTPDQTGYEGRAHSLWYCDAVIESQYAWYETAFTTSGFSSATSPLDPFATAPTQAWEALGHVMGRSQVAWPFTRLDPGDIDDFIDRWTGWFADAAQGTLQHPLMMPERNARGSWRSGS